MKKCPKCNTTYSEDSKKYCRTDGAELINAEGCPNCAKDRVTETDKFCSYCGVEFQNA